MTETVTAFDRVLARGSSFPSIAETTAGRQCVLKLAGAGPGKRALAMELVALRLARHLGLRVPEATVVQLPPDLPWQAGTDEFYEAVQRSAGDNLGIALIDRASDVAASELEALPRDFLQKLAAIDALLQNMDRTRANPNILRDPAGLHWAIDFGACLLLDRLARGALEPRLELPANHFLASNGAYPQAARPAALCIEAEHVRAALKLVPEPWLADVGLARSEVLRRFLTYVEAVRVQR
jgi:hypothetical protein